MAAGAGSWKAMEDLPSICQFGPRKPAESKGQMNCRLSYASAYLNDSGRAELRRRQNRLSKLEPTVRSWAGPDRPAS